MLKKWLICKDGECWDVSGSEMAEKKVVSKSEYFKIRSKIGNKRLLATCFCCSIVLNFILLAILLKVIL
tara:strand:- start:908 stop:1114 length:207 start_codon:yes stop_codon:yes gene_type:complete